MRAESISMIFSRHKKLFILGALIAITLAVPLTIYLVQQQQDNRSKAAATTSISFSPVTSQGSPLTKNISDVIPLAISVNPGSNLVSLVTLEIMYDATKFEVSPTGGFVPNSSVMPYVLEGPVYTSGSVRVSLSIGSDPTKVITQTSTIGTLNLKAIANTSTPSQVTFGQNTQVYSLATEDGNSENVLSTTSPSFIQVGVLTTPTNSPTPTTPVASPTLKPSSTPIPTASFPPGTSASISIFLHGIGKSGDNSNPTNHTTSNKNPLHPIRNIGIELLNNNNQQVFTTTANFVYNPSEGNYYGTFSIPDSVNTGNYLVRVTTAGFLRKLLFGTQSIDKGDPNGFASVTLVTGDIDRSNSLTVLDYGVLLDCGYGVFDPLPMTDPASEFNKPDCQAHPNAASADLNDNGIIDRTDFNLFVREIAVQNGD